ncbi:MAG: hypothetical protein K8S23_07435 [Candidatus Cloacimonetes bacterium]|nr:hypothetical protein [Candidatus Cloacimonadota bacterium]
MIEINDKYNSLLNSAEDLIKQHKYGPAKDRLLQANKICYSVQINHKINICSINLKKHKNANKILKEAHKLLKRKEVDKAVALFKKSLKIYPNSEVEQELNQIINKKKSDNQLGIAKDFERKKQFEKAIEIYREIISTDDDEVIRNRLSISLIKNKQYEGALENFRFNCNSDNEVRYYYGFALAKNKKFKESIEILEPLSNHSAIKELIPELKRRQVAEKNNELAEYFDDMTNGKFLEAKKIFDEAKNDRNIFPKLLETKEFLYRSVAFEYYANNDFKEAYNIISDNPYTLDIKDLNCRLSIYLELLSEIEQFDASSLDLLLETISIGLTYFYSLSFSKTLKKFLPEKFSKFEIQSILDIFEKEIKTFILKAKSIFSDKTSYLDIFWDTERDAVQKIGALSKRNKDFKNYIATPSFAKNIGISDKIIELLESTYKRKDDNFYHLVSLYSNLSEAYRYLLAENPQKGILLWKQQSKSKNDADEYINLKFEYYEALTRIKAFDIKFIKHLSLAKPLFDINKKYYQDILDLLLENADNGLNSENFLKIIEYFINEYDEKKLYHFYSRQLTEYCYRKNKENDISNHHALKLLKKAIKYDKNNHLAKDTLKKVITDKDVDELNRLFDKGKDNQIAKLAISNDSIVVKGLAIIGIMRSYDEMIKEIPRLTPEQKPFFYKYYHRFKQAMIEIADSSPVFEEFDFDIRESLEELEMRGVGFDEIEDELEDIMYDEEEDFSFF